MVTFAAMAVDNPSIRQQYDEWREARAASGEDPVDWGAFREHLVRNGAPDPGPRPPDDFVGEDFKAAHPEWVQRWYGTAQSVAHLLGGGPQRQEYGDFVKRYDQGAPWDGISDQEAVSRYQQIAPQLSPDVYEQSAQEAFARMSPQERQEFARHLQQRSQQQGLNFPDFNQDGIDDRYQDPQKLAQVTSRMEQQQPGILGQLLGGGGGGAGSMLANPLAKAALAGVTAMAVKRMMGGR